VTGLPERRPSDGRGFSSRTVIPAISIGSAVLQLGLLAGGGVIAILLAGNGPNQVTTTLTLIYIAYAAAWNIVAGFAGQFTFGHSAFFGIGAYAATLLTVKSGIPPLAGLWFGAVIAAAAAVAIGVITLKLRGLYFGLVTAVFPIVFAVFANYLGFQEVPLPFHPRAGVAFFTPGDPRVLSAFALCAALAVSVVSVALLRSRFGLFLGALRADQDAAEATGVATTRVKIYALALSAALSAVTGSLYASVALVVTPADVFGLQMSVKPVLFSVFGGIGALFGPILGAAILVPLSEALDAKFGASLPGLSGLVYGAALLLVITLFPGGLVPMLGRVWNFLAGRVPASLAGLVSAVGRRVSAHGENARPTTAVTSRAVPTVVTPIPDPGGRERANFPILVVDRVAKAFGGTRVLRDVTIELGVGDILGVIGPNGAGKTTLFNIINGFLRPDAGTIRLLGQDVTRARPSLIARAGIGRTFQSVRLFSGMSAIDNVLVAALTRHGDHREAMAAAWESLDEVALADRALAPVEGLTTGELRRLELARAMATAGSKGLLMLDEFLGGMMKTDGAVLLAALERWRARGGSVLAIEHTMRAMAGFVDRFVVLNFGEVIADGRPAEIWKNRDVVTAYLGEKWVA
jgi:ABC-type branched-subunit amino acid transport system ATPase component/ABC-type branched-subunit amino acid transport system permease subunit